MVLFELPDKYRGHRVSSNDQGLAHQSITMIEHRGQAATKESNVECHMYEEQLGDCLSRRKTNEHFTDLKFAVTAITLFFAFFFSSEVL